MADLSEEIERESKIIDDLLALVKLDKTAKTMNIKTEDMFPQLVLQVWC